MVVAGKVFQVKEESDLETITSKLKGFRNQEVLEHETEKFDCITEVSGLKMSSDTLEGVFSHDQVITVFHRGKSVPTPRTISAPFIFSKYKDRINLMILEKKNRANYIANQLSKTLFITTGNIVEARIPPDTLKNFHEQNFEDTKIVFFDDVDVPSVSKLSLYGSELGNTSLYTEYLGHGKIWYTVIKSKKYGYIVGITRNAVVTIFSSVEKPEFVNYVSNEIFPLLA